jgi:hypothetical protein
MAHGDFSKHIIPFFGKAGPKIQSFFPFSSKGSVRDEHSLG